MVVHVSETEASSNLAKEVGLLKKPIMVCKDVGDFEEYLIDGQNAILMEKEDPSANLERNINEIYDRKMNISNLGEKLHATVVTRFSIKTIISEYNKFNVE